MTNIYYYSYITVYNKRTDMLEVWNDECTIENLYRKPEKIHSINYGYRSIIMSEDVGDIKVVLEQLIHACLPAPDDVFNITESEEPSWREYLYTILKESVKFNE